MPRTSLNCLIAASTKTMLYALVGELELSQGGVVDHAIHTLTASITFGPASLNPKKPSKKAAHVAALKASDPLRADRDDIEYGNMELPSGGSVAFGGLPVHGAPRRRESTSDAYQARGMRQKGDEGR